MVVALVAACGPTRPPDRLPRGPKKTVAPPLEAPGPHATGWPVPDLPGFDRTGAEAERGHEDTFLAVPSWKVSSRVSTVAPSATRFECERNVTGWPG